MLALMIKGCLDFYCTLLHSEVNGAVDKWWIYRTRGMFYAHVTVAFNNDVHDCNDDDDDDDKSNRAFLWALTVNTECLGAKLERTDEIITNIIVGRDSVVRIATRCCLFGRGSNPDPGEIFLTLPDRPWCPSSLLQNGCRVCFLGLTRPRLDNHRLPTSAEVKEGLELEIFPPPASWAFMTCSTVNFY